jgi:hypothetical protein
VLDSTWPGGYTWRMRHQRLAILCLLLLASLAACSPGHSGGNEIAFLRDGQLWTVDPDGANAFEVVAGTPPVVSYGWSPSHELLEFRALDPTFASRAAAYISTQALTQLAADLPSSLNTISIDGGSAIPILFSDASVRHSNAWWSSASTRLLYREEDVNASSTPAAALWWVSQNDQPAGIARKVLPASYSIPSFSPSNTLAIGNSAHGLFTTTLAGTQLSYLSHHALAGHPLPASLERVLWQPAHSQPDILYALRNAGPGGASGVELVSQNARGQASVLANCSCTQFAWSPDGNSVLYASNSLYSIVRPGSHAPLPLTASAGSVPYWSPDSQFLLLDGAHSLTLVHLGNRGQGVLLSDGVQKQAPPAESAAGVSALLQPLANSVWASDSRHFLFLTRGRMLWQGTRLQRAGLYSVAIDAAGRAPGPPLLVDGGNDSQPGWTYQNPATSFLYAS